MRHLNTLIVAVLALVITTSMASAQPRDAGAKMRGEFGATQRSAGRSIRHARDYSRDYRTYARSAPTVQPQIARRHAEGAGRGVAEAQQDVAELRRQSADDKETLAQLDLISKHLKEAAAAHAMMHEACMQETIEGETSMKCCDDMTAALDKALGEYEKLTKRLVGDTPAPKAKAK